MPELPEVETVVRSIAPYVTGQRIEAVEVRLPRIFKGEPPTGRTVVRVTRHGKFIVLELAPNGFLIIHLGMTGKLRWNAAPEKHTHVIFTTTGGALSFTDARTFGRVEVSDKLPERVARLGPDALAVPEAEFLARLKSRKGKIKSRLLNQLFVRGLGNIYADEALFRAGIHPAHTDHLAQARVSAPSCRAAGSWRSCRSPRQQHFRLCRCGKPARFISKPASRIRPHWRALRHMRNTGAPHCNHTAIQPFLPAMPATLAAT